MRVGIGNGQSLGSYPSAYPTKHCCRRVGIASHASTSAVVGRTPNADADADEQHADASLRLHDARTIEPYDACLFSTYEPHDPYEPVGVRRTLATLLPGRTVSAFLNCIAGQLWAI